jgi:K+-sensing histidine kinase KdpD
MSIMQAIVSEHGGTLTLGPSRLGGLEIDIRIPLRDE